MPSGRWHGTQALKTIGATSVVNVGADCCAAARADPALIGARSAWETPATSAVVQIATVARRLAVMSAFFRALVAAALLERPASAPPLPIACSPGRILLQRHPAGERPVDIAQGIGGHTFLRSLRV